MLFDFYKFSYIKFIVSFINIFISYMFIIYFRDIEVMLECIINFIYIFCWVVFIIYFFERMLICIVTYLLHRYRYTAASPSFAIARTSISAHDSTYRGSYEGRLNLYHRLGRGTFQCIHFWGYLGIISL